MAGRAGHAELGTVSRPSSRAACPVSSFRNDTQTASEAAGTWPDPANPHHVISVPGMGRRRPPPKVWGERGCLRNRLGDASQKARQEALVSFPRSAANQDTVSNVACPFRGLGATVQFFILVKTKAWGCKGHPVRSLTRWRGRCVQALGTGAQTDSAARTQAPASSTGWQDAPVSSRHQGRAEGHARQQPTGTWPAVREVPGSIDVNPFERRARRGGGDCKDSAELDKSRPGGGG